MTLLSVSVSHHTADVDALARLAMNQPAAAAASKALRDREIVHEALVLSTCNRTEIVVEASRFHGALDAVLGVLAVHSGFSPEELPEISAVRYEDAVVGHAFSLAAGLESLVVGEAQIIGQLRHALATAQDAGTAGPAVNDLFQHALRVGKRVQTETAVGHAGRSVLSAALEQAAATGFDPAGRRCLVVGAGDIAGTAARALAAKGAEVTCINRTFERAQRLAAEVGGRAVRFDDLALALAGHDLVVTCTGASGRLIGPEQVRDRSPEVIIDVALPPDVDDGVRDRGVRLINLASLHTVSQPSDADVQAARDLVQTEVREYLKRRRASAVTPTVVALRAMADQIVASEADRIARRLPGLDDHQDAEVRQALQRVADKLIHSPMVRVRQAAGDDVDYAAALRTLFALDSLDASLSSGVAAARDSVTEAAQ